MSNRTRAGSRQAKYRSGGVGYGRVPPNKIAWLRNSITNQISIHEYDPLELNEEDIQLTSEEGSNFILFIPVPGRTRPLAWNFSNMTAEELEATRQFFNHLFDLADPVVRERDKVANEAEAKGDFSYARIYRDLPQFVIRERPKRKNDQSVHDGPEGSTDGS